MNQLASGLIYSPDLNKIIYSNEFIMNSGLNLHSVSEKLGNYAEYISEDNRDLLYAKSIGIKLFDESINAFDYTLTQTVDLNKEIELLKGDFEDYSDIIEEEYQYIIKTPHNILLLKIAFLLKRHMDKLKTNVYLMRGSGISSFIFYLMGLNKVNPLKFGLEYRNFWNN